MGIKSVKSNFRVEVQPRNPGDYGYFSIGNVTQSDDTWERECQEIASQIRRHVDGIARHGVNVLWDTDKVCEHCGSDWTEKNETYNGGCCVKDDESAPEDEVA